MARFDDINTLGGNGPPKDNNPLLTSRVDELMKVFEDVNTLYIEKIAEQIQIIGEMNASSINRLMIMAQMNHNIAEIKARLQKAIEYTNERMDKIMQTAYQEVQENPNFKRVLDETPLSETAENRLDQLAKSISRQTQGTMRNISNTTVVWQNYRRYIDQAILAVTSGLGSYNELTRWAVKELGYNGMQVQYASGYHRRLDSAVRANIISAANQVAQQGSDIVKEDLGMNAVELTAHQAPAPDHAPVQGRVFLNAEFAKMQNGEDFEDVDKHKYSGFERKIGEWNCMHMAMGFDTRYSVRKWTDAELKKILEDNQKGCTVNGKHYTMYQANQRMRQIETEVRRQKDVAVAAERAGNESLQEQAQSKIDKLGERYLEFSKQSGLKPKWDRMNVEGFKKYKKQAETESDTTEKGSGGFGSWVNGSNKVDPALMKSEDFKNKFKGLTGNRKVDDALYTRAKAMLTHRNGTNGEDSYILNAESGKTVLSNTSSQKSLEVSYSRDAIDEAKAANPEGLIGIHNHPTNLPPNGSDFGAAGYRGYKFGMVVCHNGDVYVYKTGNTPFVGLSLDKKIDDSIYESYRSGELDYIQRGYEKALNAFAEQYGIEWRKL